MLKVFLLLTSSVSIVVFEQLNVSWVWSFDLKLNTKNKHCQN